MVRVQRDDVALRMAWYEHLVADTADVDDDVIGPARHDLASDVGDHAQSLGFAEETRSRLVDSLLAAKPLVARFIASLKRKPCAYVRAIAMASATLSCVMGSSSLSTWPSIRCTAFLSAPPLPVTASLTCCGVYSATMRPARAPQSRAIPRASATVMAVFTFLLK